MTEGQCNSIRLQLLYDVNKWPQPSLYLSTETAIRCLPGFTRAVTVFVSQVCHRLRYAENLRRRQVKHAFVGVNHLIETALVLQRVRP